MDQRIDQAKWATPYIPCRRYGHNTSNFVEQFNGFLEFGRELPVFDFLHNITIMKLRYVRQKDASDPKYPEGSVDTSYSEKLLAAVANYNAQKREVMFYSTVFIYLF